MQIYSKGVTLLEVMIVIVVVAILAAIAYPSYINYLTKSRRAEAVRGLLSAQLKQEEWRVSHASYSNSITDLGNPTSDYYTFSVSASGSTYLLKAVPKSGTPQANDSTCSSITLNQQDQRLPATCWE
ncbi:type IV pilin protein [Pseudaeromonas paramecii]|uniref:Type IV pilin protein n=1 Tax=Pseudaeromonas paramecii TaxID=2138166 RepID=A0ABP8QBW6_9GAMM